MADILKDDVFLRENMMGPNAARIVEEATRNVALKKGMRVLDLGCGKGLTSIFLAQRFGVTVFAADLWIHPSENFKRVKRLGLENLIIPVHAEAHSLPFARGYFDAVVSVDAYHYFGANGTYFSEHLAPLVAGGGVISISVPGLRTEFSAGVPSELQPFWTDDMKFHSCGWWNDLFSKEPSLESAECSELECCAEAWSDWLVCDNEFAHGDREMMKAEGGRYFNFVNIAAVRE